MPRNRLPRSILRVVHDYRLAKAGYRNGRSGARVDFGTIPVHNDLAYIAGFAAGRLAAALSRWTARSAP